MNSWQRALRFWPDVPHVHRDLAILLAWQACLAALVLTGRL